VRTDGRAAAGAATWWAAGMDPAGAGALAGLRRPRPSLRFVLLLAGADAGSSSLFLIRKDSGRSFLHINMGSKGALKTNPGQCRPTYIPKQNSAADRQRPAAGNQAAAPDDDDARASLPR
jgi:hypothetical protein